MPPLATGAEIGSYGERVAAAFVRRNGYRVLTRNFTSERGEIDLVCRDGDTLVFVEVRSRTGEQFGRPAESIDARKVEAVRATAQESRRDALTIIPDLRRRRHFRRRNALVSA